MRTGICTTHAIRYLFGQPDSNHVIEGAHGCKLTIPIDELQKND
jgi:hypothetical protein